MADLTFGKVPKPKMDVMIVPKPYDGAGYNSVPARSCIGVCDHITDGEASIDWYFEFFSTGGQRQYDALVDFIIDKNGRIAMFNDPFGKRMPWASGGSDGLEGDGPAFVNKRGIYGINGELASKEHIGKSPATMTDAQNEASAKLSAWFFDGASGHARGSKVPWDQYPFNPNVGCVTAMQHFEFATKPCPGAGIRGQTTEHQALVRSILKDAQTKTVTPPEPKPPAPPPPIVYPNGMDLKKATELFGTAELFRLGKPVGGFGFHEDSAIGLAWLERGKKENKYPAALAYYQFKDSPSQINELVTFAATWVLYRPSSRAAWAWM